MSTELKYNIAHTKRVKGISNTYFVDRGSRTYYTERVEDYQFDILFNDSDDVEYMIVYNVGGWVAIEETTGALLTKYKHKTIKDCVESARNRSLNVGYEKFVEAKKRVKKLLNEFTLTEKK